MGFLVFHARVRRISPSAWKGATWVALRWWADQLCKGGKSGESGSHCLGLSPKLTTAKLTPPQPGRGLGEDGTVRLMERLPDKNRRRGAWRFPHPGFVEWTCCMTNCPFSQDFCLGFLFCKTRMTIVMCLTVLLSRLDEYKCM